MKKVLCCIFLFSFFCSLLWLRPCTKQNSCLFHTEELVNRNVLVTYSCSGKTKDLPGRGPSNINRVISALHYGRSPRLLWQLRYAARNEGSTINRHKGRRVGRHKLPTPERRQMTTIKANPGNLKTEPAKHHAHPREKNAWWNLREFACMYAVRIVIYPHCILITTSR